MDLKPNPTSLLSPQGIFCQIDFSRVARYDIVFIMKFFSYKLPVSITKQGKRFVAYTPALDISTSGKSIKNVQERFQEIATLFLEEIFNSGVANEVLSELGWQKIQKKWNPPKVVSASSVGVKIPVSV